MKNYVFACSKFYTPRFSWSRRCIRGMWTTFHGSGSRAPKSNHDLGNKVSEHPWIFIHHFRNSLSAIILKSFSCGYSMDVYWEHVPTSIRYAVHPTPGKGLRREFISVSLILGIPSRPQASYKEEATRSYYDLR